MWLLIFFLPLCFTIRVNSVDTNIVTTMANVLLLHNTMMRINIEISNVANNHSFPYNNTWLKE